MVDWKYLLYAQFPAFLLLSIFFLISFLRVRKSSAVKSVLWVLLFAASLAASVLFVFLGMHNAYWALKTIFPLGIASWIGIVLVVAGLIAHIVHLIEKKHSQKVMEKELKKAEKAKEDAVAQAEEAGREAAFQAHLDGRRAEREESETARLSKAAEAADAEAAASELASAVQSPIELTLETPPEPLAPEDTAIDPPVAEGTIIDLPTTEP